MNRKQDLSSDVYALLRACREMEQTVTRWQKDVEAIRSRVEASIGKRLSELPARLSQVITASAEAFGCLPQDVLTRSRVRSVSDARHVAVFILHTGDGMTFEAAGRLLDRTHGAAMYGVKVVQEQMELDPDYRVKVQSVIDRVGRIHAAQAELRLE